MATNFFKNTKAFFVFHDKKIEVTILNVKKNGDFTARFNYGDLHFTTADYPKFRTESGDVFTMISATKPTTRVRKPFVRWNGVGEKPLLEWVREILADSGRPMHYGEIRAELLDRGYECPIEPSEARTPIECRIKTRIVKALERGDYGIIKVAPATYQINE